ncbi:hypothetical protein M3Y94_00710500 [Aphelenchoides besseyi]|nr:hypothetical protein M3Y94_00710500 [Aphelenchoides besseyi]
MAPNIDRMPKLSNKQYFDLLRVHEENLAALRDCPTKPAEYEQDIYEKMCKAMQQRFQLKMSPIAMRSHVWRLKERVERKVNAAAKSGSTDEDVLLRTAGFTPIESHLYKLLTDKVLPLVVKDQREHHREHHSRSRASHIDEPQTSTPATPSPNKGKKTKKTAATTTPTSNCKFPDTWTQIPILQLNPIIPIHRQRKKARSHKKKVSLPTETEEVSTSILNGQHSEPEQTVDAYMDTIERVAQMGRTAPGSYDEHLLDIRLPNLSVEEATEKKRKVANRKKKSGNESTSSNGAEKTANGQTQLRSPRQKVNGKSSDGQPVDRDQFLLNLKLDPAALRLSTDDITNFKNQNVQPGDELQREKQLLCRTQRLLAAQRIALQTRQAEMLQSQTKFYEVQHSLRIDLNFVFRRGVDWPRRSVRSSASFHCRLHRRSHRLVNRLEKPNRHKKAANRSNPEPATVNAA